MCRLIVFSPCRFRTGLNSDARFRRIETLCKTDLKSNQPIESHWHELNWPQLSWTELNWTEIYWTELSWTDPNWIKFNWTRIYATPTNRDTLQNRFEYQPIEVTRIELNPTEFKPEHESRYAMCHLIVFSQCRFKTGFNLGTRLLRIETFSKTDLKTSQPIESHWH